MAKRSKIQKIPSSFELLAARIQKQIIAPAAQKAQAVTIYKEEGESSDDWEQIVSAISETDSVYVTVQDDDGVRIFWDVPDQD
ncbi:DUF1654 domain-containing protein [Pseudomonas putida]|jgi:hypothetical protein|uniref:DUF1654 domain-containing protein n=1 Tax=Pseudomonas putida TaxID=303 RepID=UPI0009820F42|nr:DUF1654 domain-containing protein [Pseudomonas putida]OMQ37097.1 hypothetical protein BKX96_11415 [Pseudomonas putida]